MIDPLSKEVQYSAVSLRRFLSQIGYFSSFTHNGKWYTLKSIPRFSRDGLWFYQDIGFSRAGSLTNTLVALIDTSPAGMTAQQLGKKLRCRCHSVLVGLCRRGRIQRQRQPRSHIYLSADAKLSQAQLKAMSPGVSIQLPAEIAVLVLAEFIRKPASGPGQLARWVSAKAGVSIAPEQISALFAQYGIKKTLLRPPSVS
jgi:hypothetical protein